MRGTGEVWSTLYIVSAWGNERHAAVGGIGLMLGKTSQEVFIGVKCILDRFMRNLFQGESCHDHSGSLCPYRRSRGSGRGRLLWAATLGSYEDVPAHDFLVILTDANGRFGRDDVQFAYNLSTSGNGRRHLEIMGE